MWLKAWKNPLPWNATYARENNDYTSALGARRFKLCDFFDKLHMILFHMLDTLYLSIFS